MASTRMLLLMEGAQICKPSNPMPAALLRLPPLPLIAAYLLDPIWHLGRSCCRAISNCCCCYCSVYRTAQLSTDRSDHTAYRPQWTRKSHCEPAIRLGSAV